MPPTPIWMVLRSFEQEVGAASGFSPSKPRKGKKDFFLHWLAKDDGNDTGTFPCSKIAESGQGFSHESPGRLVKMWVLSQSVWGETGLAFLISPQGWQGCHSQTTLDRKNSRDRELGIEAYTCVPVRVVSCHGGNASVFGVPDCSPQPTRDSYPPPLQV